MFFQIQSKFESPRADVYSAGMERTEFSPSTTRGQAGSTRKELQRLKVAALRT